MRDEHAKIAARVGNAVGHCHPPLVHEILKPRKGSRFNAKDRLAKDNLFAGTSQNGSKPIILGQIIGETFPAACILEVMLHDSRASSERKPDWAELLGSRQTGPQRQQSSSLVKHLGKGLPIDEPVAGGQNIGSGSLPLFCEVIDKFRRHPNLAVAHDPMSVGCFAAHLNELVDLGI